jgi:putative ABC transport system permease protein
MEIGPILRTLGRSKARFALISLEVALTLAIVVNCVNMIKDMKWRMDRPTGLDEAGIITVQSLPFAPEFNDKAYLDNSRKADVRELRSIPGVLSAETITQIPLSGSGSSSGYKPLGSQGNTLATGIFTGGPRLVATLGVKILQGRDLVEEDITESDSKNVLITKAYADRLFPDGNALGRQLQGRTPENPDTVVGIIDRMHGSWPGWRYIDHVMLRPGKPGSFNFGVRYVVRARLEQVRALVPVIETRLLKLHNGRNVQIKTLLEVKERTFREEVAVIKMLGSVILLLVFVTALGIVGITSFSVTERTHHIGTRRALGARRTDILRYFLTENWIVTTSGLVLGVALAYGLNFALVKLTDGVKLDWRLLAYGVLATWVIGQFAALVPAWRGARISPAIATRSV